MISYLNNKLTTLTEDQKSIYSDMQSNDLLQICIPTGAGKGYIMMIDLLNQIVNTENNVFAISTHRLMLNTQHMNDIFSMLKPVIGDIGYIFVGSSTYDVSKFQEDSSFNKLLLDKGISYSEIVSSTTNSKDVNDIVSKYKSENKKVVILTTYHSLNTLKGLDIDTIYCDEAHTLAAPEYSKFQENFQTINYKRCFFLTATPKDLKTEVEDSETFLMSNESVFGKRIGLNFRHCVENGYLTKPVVHIASPSDYNDSYDYSNVANMSKFVVESFQAHKKFIKESSVDSNLIEPKILVKCASVNDMWNIHDSLNGKLENIRICAGASRNDNSNTKHFIDDEGISDRSEYLERIQKFKDDEMAIVLHYDTMSEGINVAGFTGVMFLGGKLPTLPKILQNTGRATRLHKTDRDKFRNGEIVVGDGNWIKPSCAVIIPYYDRESEITSRALAREIKGLRDNFGYDPVFYISIGNDIASGDGEIDMDTLNTLDEKEGKYDLIEKINHDIEILDREEYDAREAIRLNSLSKTDLLRERFLK